MAGTGSFLAILSIVLVAGAPAQADAASRDPLPPDSSVDQYLESIPDGSGDRPFADIPAAGPPIQLPVAVVTEIAAASPVGEAVVEFAEKSAPPKAKPRAQTKDVPLPAGPIAAGGPAGLGIGLPILLAVALALFAAAWLGRRGAERGARSA